VLEIPRSGLKALLYNQDAEFEYATLSFGCQSTQGPSSSAMRAVSTERTDAPAKRADRNVEENKRANYTETDIPKRLGLSRLNTSFIYNAYWH
jgi:hypothetical protein